MKTNVLYIGDCRKIIPEKIDKESIDLIYADPPYNLSSKNTLKNENNKTGGSWYRMSEDWDMMSPEEYAQFTDEWVCESYNVLKPNGSLYMSCAYHNIADVLLSIKKLGMKVNNIITWHKSNAMPNMTKRVYTHCTEYVVWAVKGAKWIFNYKELKEINPERQKDGQLKGMSDVWILPVVQGKERIKREDGRAAHPTQKPQEMLKRIIIASSNEGDIILDPFLGSGTTAVVAQRLRRQWIGIEKEEKYVEIAKKRIFEDASTLF